MTDRPKALQITSGKALLTLGLEYPTFKWHWFYKTWNH
jgi:hypothetical protein